MRIGEGGHGHLPQRPRLAVGETRLHDALGRHFDARQPPGGVEAQERAGQEAFGALAVYSDVRVGRTIELEAEDAISDAQLTEMCDKLLANTVIENFSIDVA